MKVVSFEVAAEAHRGRKPSGTWGTTTGVVQAGEEGTVQLEFALQRPPSPWVREQVALARRNAAPTMTWMRFPIMFVGFLKVASPRVPLRPSCGKSFRILGNEPSDWRRHLDCVPTPTGSERCSADGRNIHLGQPPAYGSEPIGAGWIWSREGLTPAYGERETGHGNSLWFRIYPRIRGTNGVVTSGGPGVLEPVVNSVDVSDSPILQRWCGFPALHRRS
jgi:hypothetical protein